MSTAPDALALAFDAPASAPSECSALATITHSALIAESAKWLRAQGCAVVITDMAHGGGETADAIGWKGHQSTVVECKTSRSDFVADQKKLFRRFPGQGMGMNRYYCSTRGLLPLDLISGGWGLLEWDGRKMRVIKKPVTQFERAAHIEISLLLSAIRRVAKDAPAGVSVRCYTFDSKNRATLGVEQGLASSVLHNSFGSATT